MLCTLAGPLLACSFPRVFRASSAGSSGVQLHFGWFLGTQSPNPPLGPTLSSPAPSGICSVLCVRERASHMQPNFTQLTPGRTACGVCLTAEKYSSLLRLAKRGARQRHRLCLLLAAQLPEEAQTIAHSEGTSLRGVSERLWCSSDGFWCDPGLGQPMVLR